MRIDKITRLHYITHLLADYPVERQVRDVCRGGCRWIQFRFKEADAETRYAAAKAALAAARTFDARFIVNDDVALAIQLDADGVHLGEDDMHPRDARRLLGPDKLIGCTANTWQDVEKWLAHDIDYVGVGPFRFTTTKEKLSPVLGLEGYRSLMHDIRRIGADIPVIAIGGITPADIPGLLHAGVYGVALSGVIHRAEQPEEMCREIGIQLQETEQVEE